MAKSYKDAQYAAGDKAGLEGTVLDDFAHGLTRNPDSAFDKGYDHGMRHRHDSSGTHGNSRGLGAVAEGIGDLLTRSSSSRERSSSDTGSEDSGGYEPTSSISQRPSALFCITSIVVPVLVTLIGYGLYQKGEDNVRRERQRLETEVQEYENYYRTYGRPYSGLGWGMPASREWRRRRGFNPEKFDGSFR